MKKRNITASALLVLMLGSTLISPQQSQAGTGLAVGASAVAITGGAIMGVGGATFIGMQATLGTEWSVGTLVASITTLYVTIPSEIVGLIALDDNSQQGFAYQEISKAQGEKLGLTHSETVAYNREVETFNAIAQDIASSSAERELTVAESAQKWKKYTNALGVSAAAKSGLVKVTAQLFRKS